MAGETTPLLRRRHVPQSPPTHALAPARGHVRRARVPQIAAAGVAVVPVLRRSAKCEVRSATTRLLLALRTSHFALRRRLPWPASPDNPAVAGATRRRKRGAPGLPPPRGKVRRRRVPDIGYSGQVPAGGQLRHRTARHVPPGPPQTGRRQRRRLPGAGQNAQTFVLRRRRRMAAPQATTPLPGRGRRRHLPGTGLSATSFVVRSHRRSHAAPQRPPEQGRRRRRRAPGTGQSATTFVVLRHRQARRGPPQPPGRGRRQRRHVPGSGLAAGPLCQMRRRHRQGGQLSPSPARGQRRRGHVPGSGLTAQAVVPRHRTARLPKVRPPERGRRRRTPLQALGRSAIYPGPFVVAARQTYCGGAVAGECRSL